MKKIRLLLIFMMTTHLLFSQVWRTYNVPLLNKVAIDKQGNKWFATQNGVLKFDNTNWVKYDTINGLASNNAYRIMIDHLGNKWIGSINYNNDSIVYVTKFDGINWTKYNVVNAHCEYGYSAINDITEDSIGNIWFATSSGVSMFDGINWKYYHVKDGLPSNFVRCIVTDKFGNKWFGTQNGLTKFNGATWVTYNTPDAISGPAGNCILSLAFDKYNNLWIGGAYTLYKFQNSRIVNANSPILTSVNTMVFDRTGVMWVGIFNGFVTNNGTWHTRITSAGGITSLAVDTDNSVWLSAMKYSNIPLIFDATPKNLELDTLRGSKNYFVINSNTNWFINFLYDHDSYNWFSLSKYSGSDKDTIWVTALKDYNGHPYSVNANIYEYGQTSINVIITQGNFTNILSNRTPLINIYPNPVVDDLVIENTSQNIINKLEIYSINGSLLSLIETPKSTINMKGYKEGIYLLKIYSNNSVVIKKVMKKNK